MALPLLLLAKSARTALERWRALPAEEREQLQSTANRVRHLAVELCGGRAQSLLGKEAGGVAPTPTQRDREVIARELRDALALLAVAGTGAAAPLGRTGKGAVLGRVLGAGVKRARDRAATPVPSEQPAALAALAAPAAPAAPAPATGDLWSELTGSLEQVWGAQRLSPTAVAFELEVDEGRRQRMFATREVIPPDLEMLHVQTAIGLVAELDPATVLTQAGDMTLGSIGHLAQADGTGIVTFGIKLPIGLLDPQELPALTVVIGLLARTADRLELDLAAPGAPDRH